MTTNLTKSAILGCTDKERLGCPTTISHTTRPAGFSPSTLTCLPVASSGARDEYYDDREYSPRQRAIHEKRTKAAILHNLMVHHALVVFRDVKGVRFVRLYGYLQLAIGDRALVRLKKLDESRRPSNVQTKFVKALNSPNATIGDLPKRARRLVAGYQENGLGAMTAIFIVAPVGRKIEYSIPVRIYRVGDQGDFFPRVREITPAPSGSTTISLKGEGRKGKGHSSSATK